MMQPMLVDTSAVREALKKGVQFWEQDGEEFRLGPDIRIHNGWRKDYTDDDLRLPRPSENASDSELDAWIAEDDHQYHESIWRYHKVMMYGSPAEVALYIFMVCGGVELTPEYLEATVEIDGVQYHRHPNGGGLVHPDATVHPTAYIGPRSQVHSRATVHARALIDDATVGAGAVVGELAELGRSVKLEYKAIVGYQTTVGVGTVIMERADTGINSVIDDHLDIGERVTILDESIICHDVWR